MEALYRDYHFKTDSINTMTHFFPPSKKRKAEDDMKNQDLRITVEKDILLHKIIRMIVFKNWPLNCVQDSDYCDIIGLKKDFSRDLVRDVILATRFLVEQKMSAALKAANLGSIVHDGWTKFSVHYMCLLTTFQPREKEPPQIFMVACSELPEITEGEETDGMSFLQKMKEKTVGADQFTAEVHAEFIKKVF